MASNVISIEIPMTFKKRGGRRIFVLPDGSHGHPLPAATIDNAMVKAVARAFRWQKLLENGIYSCIDDIAKAERICPSFVGKVFRLALLAPDIVAEILDGAQPASLTLKDMMKPFPVGWAEQRRYFCR